MRHNSIADVDALPSSEPELPTKINVFAVHEEKLLIEAAYLLKRPSANQSSSPRTPTGFAGQRVAGLGMLTRCLAGLAYSYSGIRFRALDQQLQAARLQFSIGVQHEHELSTTHRG